MNRLSVAVLGLVVATGIVGCSGLVAGSAPAILKLNTSSLPGGALQHAYSASVTATGGRPPYEWGIISGQLAPGLTLSTVNGGISGTPLQVGKFTFSVQVKDSSGQFDSSVYGVNIAAVLAPIISGASPNSGPTSGGTAVTITGDNFQTGATVLFGGLAAAPVTIVSATQIQVVTSAHVAGPVNVTVRNPDGQSATLSSGFVYTAVSPTVSSVSPNTGSTAGGTSVSITGTNFLAGALVLFGTTSAPTVTVNSATQIQAITPAKAAGMVDVTVENPDGQSGIMTGAFTYTALTITSLTVAPSSTSAAVGGTATFTATDNNGSNQTAAAVWSSSAPATASMNGNVATCLVAGTVKISASIGTVVGTATLGCTTVGTASLLAGQTPATFVLPSGWTLVVKQDFESGLPSGQEIAVGAGGGINTVNPHTGTKSLQGLYNSDGQVIWWYLHNSIIGTANDIYVSYWNFFDSNATIPQELMLFLPRINPNLTTCNGTCQFVGYDWQTAAPPVVTAGDMVNVEGANSTLGVIPFHWETGKNLAINGGVWVQFEMWYHPNTATCSTSVSCGNQDGFIKLFVNGQLLEQTVCPSGGITGCLNGAFGTGGSSTTMQANMDMSLGGVITAFCDSAHTIRANPFSSCPSSAPSAFHRYIDDIIVIKK